jgi:hypothetical protein
LINRLSVGEGVIVSFLATFAALLASTWLFGSEGDLLGLQISIMASYGGIFLLLFIVLWGLPAHYLMAKYDKTKWFWYGIAGILPFPFFVFLLEPFGDDGVYHMTLQTIELGAFGVLCSSVFWFFVVQKST